MQTHSPSSLRPSVSFWLFFDSLTVAVLFVSLASMTSPSFLTDQEKVSDYEMKLMDLDVEQLGIPVSNLLPVFAVWLQRLFMPVVADPSRLRCLCRSRSTAAWSRCPQGSLPASAATCPRSATPSWSPAPRTESSSRPRESWAQETSSCPRPATWTRRTRRWVARCNVPFLFWRSNVDVFVLDIFYNGCTHFLFMML